MPGAVAHAIGVRSSRTTASAPGEKCGFSSDCSGGFVRIVTRPSVGGDRRSPLLSVG